MKNVVEMIGDSLATVRQLSILSGVPEDTMYNWKAGKSEPKAKDIKAIEKTLTEITELTRDEIKILVENKKNGSNERIEQALKIATGNPSLKVEDLKLETGSQKAPDGELLPTDSKEEKLNIPNNHSQTDNKGNKPLHSQNSYKKEDIDTMVSKLIQAQADYAIAAREDAIARRNNSEVQLRLTEMLQQRSFQPEGGNREPVKE